MTSQFWRVVLPPYFLSELVGASLPAAAMGVIRFIPVLSGMPEWPLLPQGGIKKNYFVLNFLLIFLLVIIPGPVKVKFV